MMRERQHWIWLTALLLAGAWYIAPSAVANPDVAEIVYPIADQAE